MAIENLILETAMSLKPHPLNHGFVWRNYWPEQPRLLTSDQISQYNRHGFVILRNLFDAQKIADVRAVIDAFEAQETDTVLTMDDQSDLVFDVQKLSFACGLASQSKILRSLITGPVFQGLVHDLIGDDVRLYWDQGVYKKPGQTSEFAWHQDNGYTFTLPQDYLTCWLPLLKTTKDNGCPWVMPNMHREGTYAHEHTENGLHIRGINKDMVEATAVCAAVDVGDVVVFSSLTPHMTGPNLTKDTRKAYIVQFIASGAYQVKKDGSKQMLDDPENNLPILMNGSPIIDNRSTA